MNPMDRLLKKTEQQGECLVWRGSVQNAGYGQFHYEGKLRLTHRVAYELQVGPIPGGLVVDHLCGNRLCVRADHLEPVTPGENSRRAAALITHCPQGHEYTEQNTRRRVRAGGLSRSCRTCDSGSGKGRRMAKEIT